MPWSLRFQALVVVVLLVPIAVYHVLAERLHWLLLPAIPLYPLAFVFLFLDGLVSLFEGRFRRVFQDVSLVMIAMLTMGILMLCGLEYQRVIDADGRERGLALAARIREHRVATGSYPVSLSNLNDGGPRYAERPWLLGSRWSYYVLSDGRGFMLSFCSRWLYEEDSRTGRGSWHQPS